MHTTLTIQNLMAHHEHHLQSLFAGCQQASRQWLHHEAATDPEFATWLRLRLRMPLPAAAATTLPSGVRQQAQGWQLYYQGHYCRAAEQFQRAWEAAGAHHRPTHETMDGALGLGKVYTRTGHWRHARGWILHALSQARARHDVFSITEGYGALGELLLRAGHAQAAQACMSQAFQLLPPGSGQQARQLNYLASTLMRNADASLRARSLLMTALHMGHDQGDADSVWHALARLQFLQLQDDDGQDGDLLQDMALYLPERRTPVACGLFQIGRALWLARQGSRAAAQSCLEQALSDLGTTLPLEALWARRLHAALCGQPCSPQPALRTWADVVPIAPPASLHVLDMTWAQLPLPQANGFAALLQPLGDLAREAQCRTVFFI